MGYVRLRTPEERALTEVREDAKLLLMVVRQRLQMGEVPLEHAGALARIAGDARISARRRRRAAEYLARFQMAALDPRS